MNKDTFVVRHFYDREEERIEEQDAEIEYAKKESYNKGRDENRREMVINVY